MPGPTSASSAEPAAGLAPFRAGARAVLLAGWTAGSLAVLAMTLLPVGGARARREALHRWARGAARILGLRITVEGRPPTGGFLLVANHLGYVDVITLAARVRAGFVAKAEVRRWPVWGALARLVGTMFVDRTRRRDVVRVAAQMTDRLSTGQSLIVFLEGTSTAGVGVAPFRPALLASAVASGVPVHYAAVRYRTAPGDPPADRAVCWWGDMTFAPHFRGLLGLRWIEAHVRFGTAPVWDPDRKRLAEVLHDRVTALSRGEKLMDGAAAVAPKVGAASEAPA